MKRLARAAYVSLVFVVFWTTIPARCAHAQAPQMPNTGFDTPVVAPEFRFGPPNENASNPTVAMQRSSIPIAISGIDPDTLPTVDADIDYSSFAPLTDNSALRSFHPVSTRVDPSLFPTQTSALTWPWWSNALAGEAVQAAQIQELDHRTEAAFQGRKWELENLIWMAVENSPYIQAILVEPQIFQARAVGASGQFDPTAFVDSIFNDTSDPVGNTLITGSASRLNEQDWENRSGIRVKNQRGGQAELSQQFNFKDSNSDFFVPGQQADTKMLLRYTQPLMRGRGEAYNRSSIVIANLAANQSAFEVSRKIQQHAFQITSAYWELYNARANHAQIQRGLARLQKLQQQLSGRADLDSLRSQLMRADASIARQEANQARALAQIQAAEATLRAAVASPELLDRSLGDIIPSTPPSNFQVAIAKNDELSQALDYHPEVQAIRENLKAARVRMQVAENDLRPTLDLVLEGYVRGLNGDYNATKSFGDQFSEGAPSYSAGLEYTRPYRNITARAILRERRLELRRELMRLDNVLLTISAEVEGAVANTEASFKQLESAVRSTIATHTELDYLTARWQNAFLDGTSTSLLLDQMLNAEVQLIQSENSWARAQADYMIGLAKLRLTTGTLLPLISPTGDILIR